MDKVQSFEFNEKVRYTDENGNTYNGYFCKNTSDRLCLIQILNTKSSIPHYVEVFIDELTKGWDKTKYVQEGELLVIGDTFLPYDFMNWRECCNFLIDKCYGMKRAMTLIKKDKEHLELRCPLTGEYLTVLGSPENLEHIYKTFILQNLFRPCKRS